jgi:hypothetical protein
VQTGVTATDLPRQHDVFVSNACADRADHVDVLESFLQSAGLSV